MLTEMSQCPICYGWYSPWQAHYCPGPAPAPVPWYPPQPSITPTPIPNQIPGCTPLKSLTEEDVRRIVREELNRYKLIDNQARGYTGLT